MMLTAYCINCPFTQTCRPQSLWILPERDEFCCYECARHGSIKELPKDGLDQCIALMRTEVDRLSDVVIESHAALLQAMKNSIIDDSRDTTVN